MPQWHTGVKPPVIPSVQPPSYAVPINCNLLPVEKIKTMFFVKPWLPNGIAWAINAGPRAKRLSPAGTKSSIDGRYRVKIGDRFFLNHRIVYFLETGRDPFPYLVDHIDRDPSNNKISNLRIVTHRGNMSNRGRRDGWLPVGVSRQGNRFIARICVDGHQRYLGTYDSAPEAADAYQRSLAAITAIGFE